ncbi:MAG: GNAT family N-acetyltransferase [Lachnospiraceae bacterium]|nr:GNAT family N-acetyltransferase [Candidatus Colinaster scatohippi]
MNTIRRAETRDIPGINNLLGQVLLVHHMGRPDIFKEKGQKYTTEELAEIIRDDKNPVWVCVDENNTVLGHCFCQTNKNPERPSSYAYKTLYIDDLCVNETNRGQGIGKSLYNNVLEYAKANGYYNVTLHAWECNPSAVAFYKSLGLQIQQYTMEKVIN